MTQNQAANHKIVQLIPCTGWYYLVTQGVVNSYARPVAAWALLDNGEVVGMIPTGAGTPGYPSLVPATDINAGGIYVQEDNLSDNDRQLAKVKS